MGQIILENSPDLIKWGDENVTCVFVGDELVWPESYVIPGFNIFLDGKLKFHKSLPERYTTYTQSETWSVPNLTTQEPSEAYAKYSLSSFRFTGEFRLKGLPYRIDKAEMYADTYYNYDVGSTASIGCSWSLNASKYVKDTSVNIHLSTV